VNPSDSDLNWITDRMRQIIKGKARLHRARSGGRRGEGAVQEPAVQAELIEGLVHGQTNTATPRRPLPAPTITVYKQDTFTDCASGPHVAEHQPNSDPKAFKITQVTGSYWRGDSNTRRLKRFHANRMGEPRRT